MPKSNRLYSEDLIDTYKNTFWLLDGASIPEGLPKLEEINTHWYVNKLSQGIKEALTHLDAPSFLIITTRT